MKNQSNSNATNNLDTFVVGYRSLDLSGGWYNTHNTKILSKRYLVLGQIFGFVLWALSLFLVFAFNEYIYWCASIIVILLCADMYMRTKDIPDMYFKKL